MKSLLWLAALAFSTTLAIPANVIVAWDPSPPAEGVSIYRIYEQTAALNFVQLGSTTNSQGTISLLDGVHSIHVTAVNQNGESAKSNPALVIVVINDVASSTTNKPSAPLGVRMLSRAPLGSATLLP